MPAGVTLSFVASWLLCRPAEAAGKNSMQLFGGALSRHGRRNAFCYCSTAPLWSASVAPFGEPPPPLPLLLQAPGQQSSASELLVARVGFTQSPRAERPSAGEKLLPAEAP